MKKTIELDNLRVEIRGAKYKEVKEIIRNSKMLITKAKEVGEKISEEENELQNDAWVDELIEFIIENIDDVMELVAKFTNLSREQLEDMEVPELVTLIDHILKINRINLKKTYDFLSKQWKENWMVEEPVKKFMQTI